MLNRDLFSGDTLARLAFEGETEPSYISPDDTDTLCTPINFVLNRVTGSTSTVMSCLNSALMSVITNGTQSEQVRQVLASECNPPWRTCSNQLIIVADHLTPFAESTGPLTSTSVTDIITDLVSLMGKL